MTLPSSVVMHLARLTLHDEEWSHHYHTYTVRLALAFGTGHVQFVVQELLALIVSNLAVLVVLTVLVVLAVPEFLVVLTVLTVLVVLVVLVVLMVLVALVVPGGLWTVHRVPNPGAVR